MEQQNGLVTEELLSLKQAKSGNGTSRRHSDDISGGHVGGGNGWGGGNEGHYPGGNDPWDDDDDDDEENSYDQSRDNYWGISALRRVLRQSRAQEDAPFGFFVADPADLEIEMLYVLLRRFRLDTAVRGLNDPDRVRVVFLEVQDLLALLEIMATHVDAEPGTDDISTAPTPGTPPGFDDPWEYRFQVYSTARGEDVWPNFPPTPLSESDVPYAIAVEVSFPRWHLERVLNILRAVNANPDTTEDTEETEESEESEE